MTEKDVADTKHELPLVSHIKSNFTEYIFNTNHTYTKFETNLEILHILSKGPNKTPPNNIRYINIINNHPPTY